jgi:hypothetical protein
MRSISRQSYHNTLEYVRQNYQDMLEHIKAELSPHTRACWADLSPQTRANPGKSYHNIIGHFWAEISPHYVHVLGTCTYVHIMEKLSPHTGNQNYCITKYW